MVSVEDGVIAVRAVRLVISLLAPLAAALRFVKAAPALAALVPPFAIGSCPVNVRLPAADSAMLPDALTPTVPVASGKVMVLVPPVETPVITKLFVAGVLEVPARYNCPKANVPDPRLTVPEEPGRRLVLIDTPTRLDNPVLAPPEPPRQLPLVRQTVPVASGMSIVCPPVAILANASVSVRPLVVAVTTVEPFPWRVSFCPVFPMVRVDPGLILVRLARLVISPLAPLAAAPRLVRAPAAPFALVPPFATGSCPVKETFPVADSAMLPEAEIAMVPLASGSVIVLVPPVEVPVIRKLFVAGTDEVPASDSWPNGNVPEPRLIVPAAPGKRLVLIATPARLERLVFAQLEHDPDDGALIVIDPELLVTVMPAPALMALSENPPPLPIKSCPLVAPEVSNPVPPSVVESGVVSPDSDEMSELAPDFAILKFDLALAALLAFVPPLAIPSGLVRVSAVNDGLEVVAILCGNDSVTPPVDPDTTIWLRVPLRLVTPVLLIVLPARARPDPSSRSPLVALIELTKFGVLVIWLKPIVPVIIVPLLSTTKTSVGVIPVLNWRRSPVPVLSILIAELLLAST
jgi:hypothetical protein